MQCSFVAHLALLSQLVESDLTMNTYLWTAALLACFLALGGLGNELPMVDLCRKNITDGNLEEELGKLSTDKNVLDLCDNQLKNIDPDLFKRFDRLEELVFDDNPDLVFPPDGSPFLVVKSLTKLQCVKCGVERIFNRSLQDLPKIERINLTNNRITDIERLAFRETKPIGISDWYISSYLTIIILTQIGALVILVGVWLKMKKYDSDPELDSLAGTVLNPSTIYKPLY
ncbi:hypothetical protein pipiens_008416 [Culex pipiens pipiens]|uniref:Uncharacterized protein n=1 Tax=Culex pipiens pipiens TaxID=38569 RepID=A0ABD1DHI3_CULPP